MDCPTLAVYSLCCLGAARCIEAVASGCRRPHIPGICHPPCPILACSLHKPAQQTVLPASGVPDLLAPLPVSKLRGLGGKFGDQVCFRRTVQATHFRVADLHCLVPGGAPSRQRIPPKRLPRCLVSPRLQYYTLVGCNGVHRAGHCPSGRASCSLRPLSTQA